MAWREAAGDRSMAKGSLATVDTVSRAASSVSRAGSETAASWRRHGGTAPYPPQLTEHIRERRVGVLVRLGWCGSRGTVL